MTHYVFLRKSDAYNHLLGVVDSAEAAQRHMMQLIEDFKDQYSDSDFFIQQATVEL